MFTVTHTYPCHYKCTLSPFRIYYNGSNLAKLYSSKLQDVLSRGPLEGNICGTEVDIARVECKQAGRAWGQVTKVRAA